MSLNFFLLTLFVSISKIQYVCTEFLMPSSLLQENQKEHLSPPQLNISFSKPQNPGEYLRNEVENCF